MKNKPRYRIRLKFSSTMGRWLAYVHLLHTMHDGTTCELPPDVFRQPIEGMDYPIGMLPKPNWEAVWYKDYLK